MKQAHFLKHVPCPHCNSKDNLALYSDGGGYCFGCGYVVKKKVSPYALEQNNTDGILRPSVPWLVGETVPGFSEQVVDWLRLYPESSIEELINRGVTTVKGNPNSILYQWFSEPGVPCLQQVRYFPANPKRKYITYGKPAEVLPIYYAKESSFSDKRRTDNVAEALRTDGKRGNVQQSRKLVIVEDALSAIKMASTTDSMPCLGSDIPLPKITALSRFYEEVVVWLDGNMFHKAVKMAERFALLGLKAKAVYTEHDPKCYTKEQMKNFVEGA